MSTHSSMRSAARQQPTTQSVQQFTQQSAPPTHESRTTDAFRALLKQFERFDVQTDMDELTIWRVGRHGDRMYEFAQLDELQYYPPHIHDHSNTELRVIAGTGAIILDGNHIHYRPGDRFSVPKGTSHGFQVDATTILFSEQWPPIMSDDGARIDVRYV